jgi:hypothetical protein
MHEQHSVGRNLRRDAHEDLWLIAAKQKLQRRPSMENSRTSAGAKYLGFRSIAIISLEQMRPNTAFFAVVCAMWLAFCPRTAEAQSSNVVTDWNAVAAQTIAVNAKVPAGATTLNLAITHLAIYDAVNSIDGRFKPYAVKLQAPPEASEEAAAAAAAHRVLVNLFPDQQAALDASYDSSLATISDSASKTNGIAIGEAAALAILALRANDGRNANVPFLPGTGPGEYQLTPPAFAPAAIPWLAQVTPFTMKSPSQFRPVQGPPPLGSFAWAADYNTTKILGDINSAVRTPQQTEIGLFWGVENPQTQTNRAFRGLATQQNLDTAAAARYFAIVETAAADSSIACFDAKYFYHFWRPITAIHAGDTDGNANTIQDPNWTPLAVTPNHPEFPAAHGCYTKATTEALRGFFGTDNIPITFTSTATGTTHTFAHFSDVMTEVAAARVYGGMHYPSSVQAGENIGRKVARQLLSHFFRAVDENEDVGADDTE